MPKVLFINRGKVRGEGTMHELLVRPSLPPSLLPSFPPSLSPSLSSNPPSLF